ncbi:hypothetical protein FYK55_27450 [Roseiconus nitratireducens]|uniref:Uncharacterized protein n=1 Tax=Roseiconus nitratireducens TaxID=2605748 RepID=A0A5M6CTC0_9BACT|nr:hypothetical protein [Roseiconus nitratireducens]KAA5538558.1 hypothetical protein FYK55_27450 [Roseiconus nitratireducens]
MPDSETQVRPMPAFSEFAQSLADVLSSELRSAIESAPLPPLDEGTRHPPLMPLLTGGIGDHLTDVRPARQMEILSGMWLVAGDIHQSHSISQDLPSKEGSFLHGIMHRREHDFGNSKYWFRRVGSHPVFEQIRSETDGHYSDPFDFVDQCQQASGAEVDACIDSQWVEWQALMLFLVG